MVCYRCGQERHFARGCARPKSVNQETRIPLGDSPDPKKLQGQLTLMY